MFDAPAPRLFGVPPGADFPKALVAGLRARLAGAPPEAMARVTVYLNTPRMRMRVTHAFCDGTPGLLPRLRLVTDAGTELMRPGPPPHPRLTRQWELTRLVQALLEQEPDLGARHSAFDLAGGLITLMEQADRQAVPLSAITGLDVGDMSAHWDRALRFLQLVAELDAASPAPGAAAHLRAQVSACVAAWEMAPPQDPVIVAGCTGSRGTTVLLMDAVAQLPQGALVLPGFDSDLPRPLWAGLAGHGTPPSEDHPQTRYATRLQALGVGPDAVAPWVADAAPDPARNRLISLSLRPAPVTDGWLRDGPGLGDLVAATKGLTLIEAPDPRAEAAAIALRLRAAVADRHSAALMTPDRTLSRRVTAALDRWSILPDDSAGEPLGQTPTGRLLRHVAGLMGTPLTADALVVLLKSPRVAMATGRGAHLRHTRALERSLRKYGPAFPDADALRAWAAEREDATPWAAWVIATVLPLAEARAAPLATMVALARDTAERLAAGPGGDTTGALWQGREGEQARAALDALAEAAEAGGTADPVLFTAILRGALAEEVRDPNSPHPLVTILGTQEARVQRADLMILGGLADGVWPAQPAADPWLNRPLRRAAGLPLPDTEIGLAAHDFQQAAGAPEVVLSYAVRSEEADTVPSRWLNRLINLLQGLPERGGVAALSAMRARGQQWLRLAATLDRPVEDAPRAPRPAPAPPVAARPTRLSVTEIETLLRDPYQIYARHVLRLRKLPPLRQRPEAALRGTVLHDVLHDALPGLTGDAEADAAHLRTVGHALLTRLVPWPATRVFWAARLERMIPGFLVGEAKRRARGKNVAREAAGALMVPGTDLRLSVKADRIDCDDDGRYWVYDYKSGTPPTPRQQRLFNKQLHITAYMLSAGAFDDLVPASIAGAEYVGLKPDAKVVPADFAALPVGAVRQSLAALIQAYADPAKGYTANVARERQDAYSDYDHLSRGGEWDMTQPAQILPVGDHP